MKKGRNLTGTGITTIIIVLLFYLMFNLSSATSFIQNGGFESGSGGTPDNWSTWTNDSTSFTWDSTISHNGSKSVKIYNSSQDKDYGIWSQSISGFTVGNTYKLSGYVKTSDVSNDGNKAHLAVICKDSQGNVVSGGDLKGTLFSRTQDWTYDEVVFTVPPGTSTMSVGGVLNYAAGSVWFDDIDLIDVTNYLSNAGFESISGSPPTPGNWNTWTNNNSTFSLDTTTKRSGSNSVKISNSSECYGAWTQSVSGLSTNTKYILSGYIKTSNVQCDNKKASFIVQCKDSNGQLISNGEFYSSNRVWGTKDWTYSYVVFQPVSGTDHVDINCSLNYVTGDCWFDDMVLAVYSPSPTITPLPTPTPIPAPDELGSNVGLEDGTTWPTGWSTYTQGSPTFTWDGTIKHSGNKSIKTYQNTAAYSSQSHQVTSGFSVGDELTVSGWIKTDSVSTDGRKACLSVICKDSSYNTIQGGVFYSDSVSGTQDWTYESIVFTVPTNTSMIYIAGVLEATGSVWFDDFSLKKTSRLTVSSTANSNNFDNFGAEWDPHFWMSYNTSKGCDSTDWTTITNRIANMGVKKVRIQILPEWFEYSADDTYNFSKVTNARMNSLCEYLDVCQDNNIDVTLVDWNWKAFEYPWLGYNGSGKYCSAPSNVDEAAEYVSALLDNLINTKGYTCIKEYILYNEPACLDPDWSTYWNANAETDFDHYVLHARAVNDKLIEDGLRNNIKLVGSDDSDNLNWFSHTQEMLDGVFDKFDSHMYLYDINTVNVGALIRHYTNNRTSLISKPYYFGEFGTGNTSGPYKATDIDTYNRGIFIPTHAINCLKAGGTGSIYWTMHDIYYKDCTDPNENYGLMEYGLWKYEGQSWSVRPMYHSFALLTRYTRNGSSIYDITNNCDVDAVALKTTGGNWTYLVVNRNSESRTVVIQNSQLSSGNLTKYEYYEGGLPQDDTLISSSGTVSYSSGELILDIKGKSFVVLTDL